MKFCYLCKTPLCKLWLCSALVPGTWVQNAVLIHVHQNFLLNEWPQTCWRQRDQFQEGQLFEWEQFHSMFCLWVFWGGTSTKDLRISLFTWVVKGLNMCYLFISWSHCEKQLGTIVRLNTPYQSFIFYLQSPARVTCELTCPGTF